MDRNSPGRQSRYYPERCDKWGVGDRTGNNYPLEVKPALRNEDLFTRRERKRSNDSPSGKYLGSNEVYQKSFSNQEFRPYREQYPTSDKTSFTEDTRRNHRLDSANRDFYVERERSPINDRNVSSESLWERRGTCRDEFRRRNDDCSNSSFEADSRTNSMRTSSFSASRRDEYKPRMYDDRADSRTNSIKPSFSASRKDEYKPRMLDDKADSRTNSITPSFSASRRIDYKPRKFEEKADSSKACSDVSLESNLPCDSGRKPPSEKSDSHMFVKPQTSSENLRQLSPSQKKWFYKFLEEKMHPADAKERALSMTASLPRVIKKRCLSDGDSSKTVAVMLVEYPAKHFASGESTKFEIALVREILKVEEPLKSKLIIEQITTKFGFIIINCATYEAVHWLRENIPHFENWGGGQLKTGMEDEIANKYIISVFVPSLTRGQSMEDMMKTLVSQNEGFDVANWKVLDFRELPFSNGRVFKFIIDQAAAEKIKEKFYTLLHGRYKIPVWVLKEKPEELREASESRYVKDMLGIVQNEK